MADIRVDQQSYTISLKHLDYISDKITVNNKAHFGDIVYFKATDKKLTVQLALGITNQTYATPDFIGKIHADVKYNAGKFTMSNMRFEPYKD